MTFAAQSAYDDMVRAGAPHGNPKAASAPRFNSTTFYPAGFRFACSPIAGPPPEASRIERLTITGMRFWAHGPKGDPEPDAHAVMYWFQRIRDN